MTPANPGFASCDGAYPRAVDVYRPPLRDIELVLDHIAGIDEIITYPGFEHVDEETISGALDEAGRFMAEVVAPTNRVGDTIGSRFANGSVTTPDEYKKAWNQYVDAGWNAVTGPLEYGGHGFPETVGFAVSEMFVTANLAFSLNAMLTGSAITLLRDHGSDDLRENGLLGVVRSVVEQEFGVFRDFAERGERFRAAVAGLPDSSDAS